MGRLVEQALMAAVCAWLEMEEVDPDRLDGIGEILEAVERLYVEHGHDPVAILGAAIGGQGGPSVRCGRSGGPGMTFTQARDLAAELGKELDVLCRCIGIGSGLYAVIVKWPKNTPWHRQWWLREASEADELRAEVAKLVKAGAR